MNWKNLLLSFEGRIGRAPYWIFTLVVVVVFVALSVFGATSSMATDAAAGETPHMPILVIILGLLLIWPMLAVQAKRWHDVDKSAWWILIGLVPAVGGLIALVFNGFIAGTPGPNRFGPPAA